jgi:hypothetical protein
LCGHRGNTQKKASNRAHIGTLWPQSIVAIVQAGVMIIAK